jgi:hypothetical protein
MLRKIVLLARRYLAHIKKVYEENKILFSMARLGSASTRHMRSDR